MMRTRSSQYTSRWRLVSPWKSPMRWRRPASSIYVQVIWLIGGPCGAPARKGENRGNRSERDQCLGQPGQDDEDEVHGFGDRRKLDLAEHNGQEKAKRQREDQGKPDRQDLQEEDHRCAKQHEGVDRVQLFLGMD